MQTNIFLANFFFVLSAILFLVGILVHTGTFKGWWLIHSTPVTPVGIFYALIPSSILFLAFGILIELPLTPENRGNIAMYILVPIIILILLLATLQPSWLKPKWLRWLEKNYQPILALLYEDARKIGVWEWQKRVSTQEGLEEWAEEVHKRKGL